MLMDAVIALILQWCIACMKCVFGLQRLESNLNFLRRIHVFDLVLKYVSNKDEGNWLQLLFYFIVLIVIVDSVIELRYFLACFRFQIEVCS